MATMEREHVPGRPDWIYSREVACAGGLARRWRINHTGSDAQFEFFVDHTEDRDKIALRMIAYHDELHRSQP